MVHPAVKIGREMLAQRSESAVILPPSPLTGTSAGVTIVRSVDISQLIHGYRMRLGVDVSSLFARVETLHLFHDTVTGISFFHPLITGDAAFYEALAQRPGYHRGDKAEFEIAAHRIPAGARVLEVGAGIGHFCTHLRNTEYTGLEFNAAAVEAAQALGRPVYQRDVLDMLPEQPERFDVTCAFQVMEHVPDPRSLIAAMIALTRPGGQIIISTPNAGAYISRCRDLLNAPPHHVTWWEDRTWYWLAEAFCLADVEIHHTPIDEMLGAWAQMIASDGIATQLGLTLDPLVDESPLRHRIDQMARPIVATILAGLRNRADIPQAGHTTVAIYTKPQSH
jgi:SAM-dependent methyltransferase